MFLRLNPPWINITNITIAETTVRQLKSIGHSISREKRCEKNRVKNVPTNISNLGGRERSGRLLSLKDDSIQKVCWSVVMNNVHICSGRPISNCYPARPRDILLLHLAPHPKNHFHPIAAFSLDFAAYQIMEF